MRPAYLTVIKDEENLIYKNLVYHYNIGIRDFYIIFNNSNAATKEEVLKFAFHKDINIHYEKDNDFAYRQPQRFKKLSDMAYSDGCDWMVPIDADEILKLTKYKSINEILQAYNHHEYGYIICSWIDYHPTEEDDPKDNNYFTRWKYREKVKRKVSKVIVKWNPKMMWGDGHHLITTMRKDLGRTKVMIYAHFPNREYEQLKKKIITIGEAFIKTFGIDSPRAQVKNIKNYKKQGEQFFKDKWNELCNYRKNNFHNFKYDPINPELFK
jgi:hypothetical protein